MGSRSRSKNRSSSLLSSSAAANHYSTPGLIVLPSCSSSGGKIQTNPDKAREATGVKEALICDRLLYQEVPATQTKNSKPHRSDRDPPPPTNHCRRLSAANSLPDNPDPSHPKQLRRLRRSLACARAAVGVLALALLCLGGAAAFVAWRYCQGRVEGGPGAEQVVSGDSPVVSSVCLTSDCVTASAAIIESLDPRVDPCEDFYGFVCNGWIDKHPIPKGQSSWSVTDQRSEDNLEMLRTLLERPLDYRSSKSEQKAQLLYRSCLDSGGRIEELGAEPLREVVEAVGGWNLTGGKFESPAFDLRRKLAAVQRFNTNALFHWYVREGMQNTSRYELFIHQGGLTFPSKEFYTRDKKSKAALYRFISSVVSLLDGGKQGKDNTKQGKDNTKQGKDGKQVHAAEIQDMVEFETSLAEISTRDDDITGMYVPLSRVDDWAKLTPTWGSWRDFFNQILRETFDGSGDDKINYLNGDTKVFLQYGYLVELENLLSSQIESKDRPTADLASNEAGSTSSEARRMASEAKKRFFNTLNNYLTWRAIQPYISYLSKDFQRAEKTFLKSLQGTQGREERWRTCVINANSAMGFAVAPAFVGAAFSEESRARAHEMVGEIKTAFKERLSTLDWISASTADRIREKINNTSEMFGYPDFILNAAELDKGYEEMKVSEREFFKNQVRFHRFTLLKNLRLLGQDVDKTSWPLNFPPSTVNAFYMYSRNQILFPAGVLQPPLFSERQPMALNFGHIGTFMGHELLHGFDDTGRLYGPSGQKLVWWPNDTSDAFKAKTKCFVRQYSQEIFSGRTVDGRRTLSENIADTGGLLAAYSGFRAWGAGVAEGAEGAGRAGAAGEGGLPGLPYTQEQLVFLGFARAHCSSTREKAMDLYLLTDRHSPSHVRVNTAVSNLPEFARAWNCSADSALNLPPNERCSLW